MIRRLTAISLLTAVVCAGAAQAQGARQDFVLRNKTGYDLSELYLSPADKETWEEDMFADEEDNMLDGESRNITFTGAGKTCMWDLKVVYAEDDSSAIWHDIDLCKTSRITLFYNRRSDKTSAEFD